MSDAPRILLFTGDGKGKTTAALGMALRAIGHGLRACVIQFVKGDASVGELAASKNIPHLEIIQTGLGFLPKPDSPKFAEHQAVARDALAKARAAIVGGQFALVVLDEVCFAVARNLVDEREVIEAIELTPPGGCVVLTGRGATDGLIAAADTVTEMRPLKHAYQTGRPAQRGVEW